MVDERDVGDVIVELALPREKLATGGTFPVSFVRHVPCATCKGTARKAGAPGCADCEGKGRVEKKLEDATAAFLIECAKCGGRGHAVEDACADCPRGFTKTDVTMEVEVPPLSTAGVQLRIPEQGHVRPEKPPGNVVVVLVASDPTTTEDRSPAAAKAGSMVIFLFVCVVVVVVALMFAR